MPMARTVEACLERYYLPYAVISHSRSITARETARAAAVTPNQIAKAVMLADEDGFVMAVVPGDRHADVERISQLLERPLDLVNETRFARVFEDCEPGAIPPIGPAYGIETIVDDRLLNQEEIYFVAGDHDELVCVDRDAFVLLLKDAEHGRIST
jgi:Ala-tRNA(Pro) deacylase